MDTTPLTKTSLKRYLSHPCEQMTRSRIHKKNCFLLLHFILLLDCHYILCLPFKKRPLHYPQHHEFPAFVHYSCCLVQHGCRLHRRSPSNSGSICHAVGGGFRSRGFLFDGSFHASRSCHCGNDGQVSSDWKYHHVGSGYWLLGTQWTYLGSQELSVSVSGS